MEQPAQLNSPSAPRAVEAPMTLSRLRHDIRNYLNAIKLSCALLQRREFEDGGLETVSEIDRSADGINELVGRYLADADAAALIKKSQ
jgi:nitrogen-specific signal transduction histidine kinase